MIEVFEELEKLFPKSFSNASPASPINCNLEKNKKIMRNFGNGLFKAGKIWYNIVKWGNRGRDDEDR